MTNPHTDAIENRFRGHKVRVRTADGRTITGWCKTFQWGEEVILEDAIDSTTGTTLGSTVINDYTMINRIESQPDIIEVAPSEIKKAPYASRTYDDKEMAEYTRFLRDRENLMTVPTVRPAPDAVDTAYELLGGHKRLTAARRAGFETIPVYCVATTDWEALRYFVDEHFPLDEKELASTSHENRGYYGRQEIAASLEKMREDWNEDKLQEIPALEQWLDTEDIWNTPSNDTRASGDASLNPYYVTECPYCTTTVKAMTSGGRGALKNSLNNHVRERQDRFHCPAGESDTKNYPENWNPDSGALEIDGDPDEHLESRSPTNPISAAISGLFK